MKIIKGLLLALILCMAFTSNTLAHGTNCLIQWGSCISSDPPGSPDCMDSGNPNEAADVGTMECRINPANQLECEITNGYPGYLASVYTKIINISERPVKINNIRVTGSPDFILVSLTDRDGNDLVNQVIDRNSTINIKVVSRISHNAAQFGNYRFQIELVFNQERSLGLTSSSPSSPDCPPASVLHYSNIPSPSRKKVLPTGQLIVSCIKDNISSGLILLNPVAKGVPAGNASVLVGFAADNQQEQYIIKNTELTDGRAILFMGALGSLGLLIRRRIG